MTVKNFQEAWEIARELSGMYDFERDELASTGAGYDIYRAPTNYNVWVSVLGDHLELNLPTKSFNIWIEQGFKVNPKTEPKPIDKLNKIEFIKELVEQNKKLMDLVVAMLAED